MSDDTLHNRLLLAINNFLIVCLLLFVAEVVHGASLNLAWNANTEPDLAGYRIYLGTSSGNYTSSLQAVKVTSHTLTELNEGTTYYIAMTAFDTSLNESQRSAEITAVARGAEKCNDGIDNDGDGLIDCADPECNNQPCNDNNLCTASDTCSGGACVGGPALNCDDGKLCTSDSCNPQTGCVHTALPGCCSQNSDCADNNLCNGTERCNLATGSCIPGKPLSCEDGNSCTDDSCDPQKGCVYTHNSAPCDDGLFCNGHDTCGDGSCSVHSGDPCKQLTCKEETDSCEDVGIICDNPETCASYSGYWSLAARADAFGGNARVASKSATHTWTPQLPRQGFYDVSMWWSAQSQGCTDCPVEITCNGKPVGSLSINQQHDGGQWNLLGTYELAEGRVCSVVLTSTGLNKKTCADAVKMVFRGETLPEARISSITPNPADPGEEVYFEGTGSSPSGSSIIGYNWVSDRDGEIGSSDVLYLYGLSEGKHHISFSVQNDEGAWSFPASETLYIGGVEITCDNGEDCTSSTGTWNTLKSPSAFNKTSLVSTKKGSYTWSPHLPVAGYYEVYLWWSALFSNCSRCPVTVSCGGEVLDTVSVNQKAGGGRWNLLGSYELEQGTACAVTIKSPGSYSTIADAAKFVLTDNPPDAPIELSH